MLFIAHRGNIYGPNKNDENTIETIEHAISMGFDCEIDVWHLNGVFWLGHDYPQRIVEYEFLEKNTDRLWVHCKNLDALLHLRNHFNCFYHDKDVYTITTKGHIWGNIGSPMNENVIQVMPEKANVFSFDCAGICTDFPIQYRDIYIKTIK